MNIPVEIIDRYDAILQRYCSYSKCMPNPGTSIPHLRWMLNELRGPMIYGKANRWLGFIQGIMVSQEMISVEVERDFTRPLFQTEREEQNDQ